MKDNPHFGAPMVTWGSDPSQAHAAVLAVHGRGQDPGFMQEQSRRLKASRMRFYAPHAAGSSWYPQPFLAPLEQNEPALTHALDALTARLEEIKGDGFAAKDIFLWGFSQGACLVSQLALTRPDSYAGLLLHTGGFVGPNALPVPAGQPLWNVHAVVRSPDRDAFVPRQRVEETAAALRSAGATVDLRIAPGTEHIITDEAMAASTRLLAGTPVTGTGTQGSIQ
jgi:phospholipase/carboxylesterase